MQLGIYHIYKLVPFFPTHHPFSHGLLKRKKKKIQIITGKKKKKDKIKTPLGRPRPSQFISLLFLPLLCSARQLRLFFATSGFVESNYIINVLFSFLQASYPSLIPLNSKRHFICSASGQVAKKKKKRTYKTTRFVLDKAPKCDESPLIGKKGGGEARFSSIRIRE